MTQEQLISFIDTYIRNSAYEAFTNLRLNTALRSLATGGITNTYETYAEFESAILANREKGEDWYIRARINSTSFIYEYFPDTKEINWTASQKYKSI